MDIKKIIQEEIDSFDWANGDSKFHINMCLEWVYNSEPTPPYTIVDIVDDTVRLMSGGDNLVTEVSIIDLTSWVDDGLMTFCQR
jgi:hypothetical protein